MNYPAIEALYHGYCQQPGLAIDPHLPRLCALAALVESVTEFGVKRGASTTAFLLGGAHVRSYDVMETPQACTLEQAAGDRWLYSRPMDSCQAPITYTHLLFIDSLHTYVQCKAELDRHADAVTHYLVFHDTLTFGSIGADGETSRHSWDYAQHRGESVPLAHLGIRPAIDELLIRDPSWRVTEHHLNSHGLLVLERQ